MLGVLLTLLGYVASQRNKKKRKNREPTPIGTPSYQIIRSQNSIKGHFQKKIENQTSADSSFVNQVNAVKLVKA